MSIQEIATALMAPHKGILAADESESTMEKRFAPIGVPQNPENNRRYRNLLFTTPDIEQYLSGIILHDQTIQQSADSGVPFPTLLTERGIIVGIKVDQGIVPLEGCEGEEVSQGFDDLHDRLHRYYEYGARFTKWRSVIHIADGLPSSRALDVNAQVLAKYAKLVQMHDMVPIVEPEVLFDGTHTLAQSEIALHDTLTALFGALDTQHVDLSALILKTSMVLPGRESGIPFDASEIAHATSRALRACVPLETAGIVFLSGGQTSEQATQNLDAIARLGDYPWRVSFSYSRAIEEPVLLVWKGDDSAVSDAQKVLITQLQHNVSASDGVYLQ